MSTPLTLVVTLTAHPGQAAALEAGLSLLVPASQAEAGCLQYDLHRRHDDPRVFCMIEQWQDAAVHAAHQQTAHFLTCGGLLERVEHHQMQRIL
ncbi:antibiotic biosynthesis monooxygenase [Pseudomonas lalucatii]|nr:antibiotic biosynthesis monooxygenase [Pseudomonas lalucatii]